MVERRPWLSVLTHLVLMAGVAMVAFPLYITFVASTLTLEQVLQVPMRLLPGDQFWANYTQVLGAGSTRGSGAPVAPMLWNSLVMASVWKQISYNFLFFLAGLQSIPKSLIEAAAIDGARPFRRFWTIVFPLLSPTTFFLLVVNIVYAFFDTFGVIDATTQGGPSGATQILVYKVYNDGVKAADLGGSSAQSAILMLIVVVLTVAQFRFVERRVNY